MDDVTTKGSGFKNFQRRRALTANVNNHNACKFILKTPVGNDWNQ